MRIHKTFILLTAVVFSLFTGCQKWTEQEKYKRPEWLPGKLYTTVLAQENLSLFAECLQLAGLDTILDVSGSWSVFAPDNEAIKQYLIENQYAGVSDIPKDKLEKITEFHVIQNPWTLDQLQGLSAYGWRSENNEDRYSYAYKRQTMLKNPVEKYWIKKTDNKERIVLDSTTSDRYKKVYVESRKNVPIFYDDYIAVNDIASSDFNFYFDRPYETGNVYYAGAKILKADIFAENGFVHIVDRVVNPMLNARELLERELPGESYKLFLKLVYWYYPSFEPNMTATNNQPAVRYGGVVDTLWDLNYHDLAFAPHQERIGYEGPDLYETWVRHNGIFAPTDDPFREFVDGILTQESGYPHWRDYQSLPRDVVEIIVSPHFMPGPVYPSTNYYRRIFNWNTGFKQNEGDIIRREFGSNCTFIGIDSYKPDRVFTSITGPVFLRPTFSLFRQAILYSRIEDDIAYNNGEYCFFIVPDGTLRGDSSLIINWIDKERNRYNFEELNRSRRRVESLSRNTISNRILNHVGTSVPNGSANKEFIRNLMGNYIILNNSDNTIQGNIPSTIGYNGDSVVTNYAVPLEEPADNGKAWRVTRWLNFESRTLRTVLFEFPFFYNLVNKAGLFHPNSFLYDNEYYTIFIPTEEALMNYEADKLSIAELRTFIKQHCLKGTLVFTDNKQPSGDYPTETGSILQVKTGPDVIEILDESGDSYIVIHENEDRTNQMVFLSSGVNAVVHETDKVIIR